MPFGTRILDDGRINFRLWAPSARAVELHLQGSNEKFRLAMAREAQGWFTLTTSLAAPGYRYRYRIDQKIFIPDPASRFQPDDVHDSSQIIDPESWQWKDKDWKGLPWEKTVLYQLHVGTFSKEGTFTELKMRLDYLVDLGINAIQLLPIADFAGHYNWGYDGVLPFAPASRYGSPDDLKDLIDTAHSKGLMVFNDVVYNHFGPEGNYLHHYAPRFFSNRLSTPWGKAINFDGKDSGWVRRFFIDNALHWLEEYHFDGLRLDAVHTIRDDSKRHFLHDLAEAVREGPGQQRQIHLVLENDHNSSHYLRPDPTAPNWHYNAQWNDDLHHSLHVLLTGEDSGYYQDYIEQPHYHLGRCLAEGFAYQGERSAFRGDQPRGQSSADLPPTAFVSFLQNHDQIGNRALGERLSNLCAPEALRAATIILLLSPSPPMLFMGQEWASQLPFTYFVDFPDDLGRRVARGRLKSFAGFREFRDPKMKAKIPLPNAVETYRSAVLDWDELKDPPHVDWLTLHRKLLRIRRERICPKLNDIKGRQPRCRIFGNQVLFMQWTLGDESVLTMIANLGNEAVTAEIDDEGELLYANAEELVPWQEEGVLEPWAVFFLIKENCS